MRYQFIIYWSKPDKSFIVEVPELPGCMADGNTYEEAIANAQAVVKEWIEKAQSLGRAIPEPKGNSLTLEDNGEWSGGLHGGVTIVDSRDD